MMNIFNAVRWAFGAILCCGSIGGFLSGDFFAALAVLIAGVLILPPTLNFIINDRAKALRKECSACKKEMSFFNTPLFGFGKYDDGKEMCTACFKKVISYGSKVNKREFSAEEVDQIINGEIKNRPLPNSISRYNIPVNEIEEINHLAAIDSVSLNSLAQISYTDAQGLKSVRRITVRTIFKTGDNDYSIDAHCHERKAERTFKLSRISELVDIETGEIFSNPSKYFLDRLEDSPIGYITKVLQELESEILVLTFIARADGYLRKKERQIISDFINVKSNQTLDMKMLDDEIRKAYCDSSTFRSALKKLSQKNDVERKLIFQLATAIVQTDKSPDLMEIGILELIEKEMGLKKTTKSKKKIEL